MKLRRRIPDVILSEEMKRSLRQQARITAYEKMTEIEQTVIQWTYEWFPEEFKDV
jgi:hypothetical protein